jgi:hypothetical protein
MIIAKEVTMHCMGISSARKKGAALHREKLK